MQTLILRWSFRLVGALLIVLNTFHLTVGFVRLQKALLAESIPQRFAEALKTAWLYVGTLGLVFGVLLLWTAGQAAAGDPVAWKVGTSIGVALVLTGVASFLATGKHPGLLVVSLFGLVLLIPLLLFRSHFRG